MNFKQTFIDSRIFKEVQGGALGILVALILYAGLSALPSSQHTKGLLVDSIATPASDAVRVNDKTADTETLRRLAARAEQIATQKSQTPSSAVASSVYSSVASPSVTQVVIDHADRTAWIAMRRKQRDLASTFDLSVRHAASPILTESAPIATPVKTATRTNGRRASSVSVTHSDTKLPDSGPVLNTVIFASLALAAVIRKRSSIAAPLFAS